MNPRLLKKHRSLSSASIYRNNEKQNQDSDLIRKYRICLKFVPKDVTVEKIEELCSKYGKVLRVDAPTRTPFKFVSFSSLNEMERAITGLSENPYGFEVDRAKQRILNDNASLNGSLMDIRNKKEENTKQQHNGHKNHNNNDRKQSTGAIPKNRNHNMRNGHCNKENEVKTNQTKEDAQSDKKSNEAIRNTQQSVKHAVQSAEVVQPVPTVQPVVAKQPVPSAAQSVQDAQAVQAAAHAQHNTKAAQFVQPLIQFSQPYQLGVQFPHNPTNFGGFQQPQVQSSTPPPSHNFNSTNTTNSVPPTNPFDNNSNNTSSIYGNNLTSLKICALCSKYADKTCGRCGDGYCSNNCQRMDWERHRYICYPMPCLLPAINCNNLPNNLNQSTKNMNSDIIWNHNTNRFEQHQHQNHQGYGEDAARGQVLNNFMKFGNSSSAAGAVGGAVVTAATGAHIIIENQRNNKPEQNRHAKNVENRQTHPKTTTQTPSNNVNKDSSGSKSSSSSLTTIAATATTAATATATTNSNKNQSSINQLTNQSAVNENSKKTSNEMTKSKSINGNKIDVPPKAIVESSSSVKKKSLPCLTVESIEECLINNNTKSAEQIIQKQQQSTASKLNDKTITPTIATTALSSATRTPAVPSPSVTGTVAATASLSSSSVTSTVAVAQAVTVTSSTKQNHDQLTSVPSTTFPESGSRVQITAIMKPNFLYIRSLNIETNVQYVKILNTVNNESKKAKKLEKMPQKGDLVAADFSDTGYCRALVINPIDETKILVAFIDIGNVEMKRLGDLKELSAETKNLKRYVIPVHLKGIPLEVTDTTKYKNIMEYLDSYVDCVEKDLKIVYEKPNEEVGGGGNNVEIELIDLLSNESINKKILDLIVD